MRKNTKIDIICSAFLGILLIGWIIFLDSSVAVSTAAEGESNKSADGATPTIAQQTADMGEEDITDVSDNVPAASTAVTPTELTPTEIIPEITEVVTPTVAPTETPTATLAPTSTPTPTNTPTPTEVVPEELTLPNVVVAKVEDFVNIRSEASTTADIVGKLVKDSYGLVVEKNSEWTKVKSGNITGYVSNAYLYSGEAAIQILKEKGALKVEINVGEANVRIEPNTDCSILMTGFRGDKLTYIPERSNTVWYAVNTPDGNVGYISASLVTPIIDFATATNIE